MATLTAGLKNFQGQLDKAFPNRVKPDGTIGDKPHQLRISGHNPDDTPGSKPSWNGDKDKLPEIRGLDIDHRLIDCDPHDLVLHLIRLPKLASVFRFLIFDGWIYHSRVGFMRARQVGDQHPTHIHVEGAWTDQGDSNTTYDFKLEDVPVALNAADKTWLKDALEQTYAKGFADAIHKTQIGRTGITVATMIELAKENTDKLLTKSV